MWNAKNIALVLLLLFCSKPVMNNHIFGIMIFGEWVTLTKSFCDNKKESIPDHENQSDQQPVAPATSCSSTVFAMLYAEDQQVNLEMPQFFSDQNYFYHNKIENSVFLDLQSPPPKLA